ncbi:MAG: hypothetical protein ACREOJ_07155 [Gemmatimonadaceae bacterium]
MKASLVLLSLGLAIAACSSRSFSPINGTMRIDVRANLDSLGTITDPGQIAAIVSFVNERASGWAQPWAGVPVGTLGVTLFRDRDVQGSFSVGSGFFVTQREGDFFSRDATAGEIAQFRSLLAPYANAGRRPLSMSPNER